MKTLIDNTNVSIYLFEDSDTIDIQAGKVVVNGNLNILDLNSGNCSLVTGVTDPGDWQGYKYFYNGSWVLNPGYEEPEEPELPPIE